MQAAAADWPGRIRDSQSPDHEGYATATYLMWQLCVVSLALGVHSAQVGSGAECE